MKKYWRWALLVVNIHTFILEYDGFLESYINSQKLQIITEICIYDGSKYVVEGLLTSIADGVTSNLKTLTVDLYQVPNFTNFILLSQAALSVEDFTIMGGKSKALLGYIFHGILHSLSLKLKSFTVGLNMWIHLVDPKIFGRAGAKLNTLICHQSITSEQLEQLITYQASPDSALVNLQISGTLPDMTNIDPSHLSSAIVKMKYPSMFFREKVRMSSLQLYEIFTRLINGDDILINKGVVRRK